MVELTYPAYVVESNPGPYWRECAIPLDQNVQVCGIFGGILSLILLQHSLHQDSLLKCDEKLLRIWALTQILYFIFLFFWTGMNLSQFCPFGIFLIIFFYIYSPFLWFLMKTKDSFMITNAMNVYECTILRVRYWHFYLVNIYAQPSV